MKISMTLAQGGEGDKQRWALISTAAVMSFRDLRYIPKPSLNTAAGLVRLPHTRLLDRRPLVADDSSRCGALGKPATGQTVKKGGRDAGCSDLRHHPSPLAEIPFHCETTLLRGALAEEGPESRVGAHLHSFRNQR